MMQTGKQRNRKLTRPQQPEREKPMPRQPNRKKTRINPATKMHSKLSLKILVKISTAKNTPATTKSPRKAKCAELHPTSHLRRSSLQPRSRLQLSNSRQAAPMHQIRIRMLRLQFRNLQQIRRHRLLLPLPLPLAPWAHRHLVGDHRRHSNQNARQKIRRLVERNHERTQTYCQRQRQLLPPTIKQDRNLQPPREPLIAHPNTGRLRLRNPPKARRIQRLSPMTLSHAAKIGG